MMALCRASLERAATPHLQRAAARVAREARHVREVNPHPHRFPAFTGELPFALVVGFNR